MCGASEMNGYAFSLGFNNLENSYTTHSDLRSLIRSATYLIRSAIFRPRYTAIRSGRASLGELIDLYHTREASERHDKVYALLGMSSEDPSAAGLEPDYDVSWEEVLQRLVKVLISEEVSVQIWNGKMAVIQSKGYILGRVSKVKSDNDQYDKQYVEVIFKALTPSEYREIWTLRSPAKSIQPGDLICRLKGTSKPTIIRAYKDHSTIIVIAVTPLQSVRTESEHPKHSGPSVSMESFVRDFLLVWNWENSLDNLQTGEGHENLGEIDTAVSEYLETASRKAIGLHDVALILRDSGKFKEAERKLQEAGRRLREAIAGYEEAFDSDREYTLAGIDKLALTYKGQEKWKEAEEWFSQAIRMRKRVKGMNHQDTLNSIANLASSYVAQGRSSAEGPGKMTDLVSRIRDNARIPEGNARIPEAEVAEVAGSFDSRFLSLLLDLWGDNVPITEKVVKAAAGNEEGVQVMELLFERCANNVQITKEVVKAAVGNNRYGKDILTLLKQRGGNLSVTQEMVMIAAKNIGSGEGVMKLLLERRENDVWITEGVVQAAAEYLGNAEGIIALLLERGGVGLITEEVVKAAAGNIRNGKEVMKVLLDRTANDIPITDVVVKVVAGNKRSGKEVMELLLERRGDEIKITEEVVKEAVGNKLGGKEIIKLLLERREKDVQITEGVVKAAARNYLTGTSIIELLIKQGGGNIMITEEAIVQIARSFDGRVMTLLFEQRGKDVQITEGVVKAAAEDWLTRTDVMKLLLKQGGDNITSTEEARVQIAKLFDETVMALLFERRGNVLITERMVKAAARNKENGKEVMEFLLKRKSEIVVTEGVVRAAARNTESGEEVMILLLKQKRDDIHIKEEAAVLIRELFSDAVTALLPERRGTTPILQDEYY
jgi:tetratricopeptide (TPR) repeat protein